MCERERERDIKRESVCVRGRDRGETERSRERDKERLGVCIRKEESEKERKHIYLPVRPRVQEKKRLKKKESTFILSQPACDPPVPDG